MAQQQMVKEEKSLGELFSELATETSTLVRQEVALAQTELTQKATRAGKNVGYLAVGGFVAYAAMLAVLAGIIMLLGLVIPVWLSAIIVGLVVGGIGYFLISSALSELRKTDPVPRDTVETIKEDAQWLKNQVT
jgi:hypothetical protein